VTHSPVAIHANFLRINVILAIEFFSISIAYNILNIIIDCFYVGHV